MTPAIEYLQSTDTQWKIDEFLKTVSVSFIHPQDIYPKNIVERESQRFAVAMELLGESLDRGETDDESVARLIYKEPTIVEFAQLVLALSKETVFADGRRFTGFNRLLGDSFQLAALLREMNFWDIF